MDRLGHAYHKEAVRNYHRSTEKDSGEADVDSMHRQNHTVKTPGEIEIIAVRLDEDFRNGVLVLFEKHGVAVENLSQMMLVEKKTDEGQIHAFSNTRVVVVCSQDVNKISPVTVFGTDNLAKVSHKATIASAYPWKYKLDTKKAFRRIEPTEMPPKLTQRLPVVFIPQPAAGLATSAVYNQFGCKSPTRFLEMFDRHFEFTS